MMRTSSSGMGAQADRLGTISDNIANAKTTGYKRADAQFSTLVLDSGVSTYQSGGVEVAVRRTISSQGAFDFTSSATDLAVKGNGYFVVQGGDGMQALTRAGAFVLDKDGKLVNTAGYTLLGYELSGSSSATPVANGTGGLEEVSIGGRGLSATPTSKATLTSNLPSAAGLVTAGQRPSDNIATSTYSAKTSLVAYGNLGEETLVDVYFAKTAASTWQVAVFDRATATSGSFPYTGGPLGSANLTFDALGQETSGAPSLNFTLPGGAAITLDLKGTSQLAADFQVLGSSVDGNAASAVEGVEVDDSGIVNAVYANGNRVGIYQIPLATVISPDRLSALTGNVFVPNADSGSVRLGLAMDDGRGSIVSGALEQSDVDIAAELTTMIETQRVYTANSKVFQTGAELSDVLVNLIR